MEMTNLVPLIATDDDKNHGWRHAFCYADCRVSTDDAEKYANHYLAVVADVENLFDWPDHSCALQ